MARILGIDYGARRIGAAIADPELRIAMPLATIDGCGQPARDVQTVIDFAKTEDIGEFVVGLPLNMSDAAGTDSKQTTLTRRFAAELARLSGRPVHLHDERLSSCAADEALDEAGVAGRRRKGLRDRIAAQRILQGWLDQLPRCPPPPAC